MKTLRVSKSDLPLQSRFPWMRGWSLVLNLATYWVSAILSSKLWSLPADWVGVTSLKITEITPSALNPLSTVEVKNNQFSLQLAPQQAIMIEPADGGQP